MSYVLGQLGAKKDDNVLNNLLAQFGAAAAGVAKQAVKDNFTRYQAYNVFRFNDSSITSSKDKKLTALMKRDSKKVMTKATEAYKAYEAFIVYPYVVSTTFNTSPSGEQMGAAAYEIWKNIWSGVIGEEEKTGDGGAGAAGATDNTMLYVGAAALLAIVAIGMRRQSANA